MGSRRLAVVAAALLGAAPVALAELPPVSAYLGSGGCAECHRERHEGWQGTYHSSVVGDPKADPAVVLGDFSQEGVGFGPTEVAFTIGGHWYQRYATRVGGETYVLPRMWSVASHRWEEIDRWSWQKKPYHEFCIGCHATRYDPGTREHVEHRVGCEACHGPGRAHAESGGRAAIANPARWTGEEQDLLCASCHVRGADPSGRYTFAVGYVPGERLEDHYVPLRIRDGETPRQSFLRQIWEWRARLGSGPPPTCDVCGIQTGKKEAPAQSVSLQCQECHRYGDRYSAHTRHPGSLELECLDCHRRFEQGRGAEGDVHTRDYFQVHRQTAYQADAAGACRGCHADLSAGEVERHLSRWDHRGHDRPD